MNGIKLGGLVAVLGLLAPWAPAAAQMNLAAQASNLRYTVTDLAPGDGVAAAIDFSGAPVANMYASVQAYGGSSLAASSYATRLAQGPSAMVLDPWAGAHLGMGNLGTGLVAAASLDPIDGILIQSHEFASLQPWDFQLAPHTQVTFSMDVGVDLTSTGNVDGEAQVQLGAFFYSADRSLAYSRTDGVTGLIGAVRMHEYIPNDIESRTATIEYTNDSDAWIAGQLSYYVRLEGILGSVSPVPEPSQWGMLLAGVGALCARARRGASGRGRAAA